jgi:large subunit ribosomal protein L9
MEVILLQDVDNLGARGQLVKVADGYGRNYLLPKKIAVLATPQSRKWIEQQRVRFLKLNAKEKADAEELGKMLAAVELSFQRKTGEQGALFGSVTSLDVADALAERGYKIDRRRILVDPPLKVLGEYEVPVRLHREVTATVKVKVESDEPASEAAPGTSAAKPEASKA